MSLKETCGIKIDISIKEKNEAKRYAKSLGYSFGGWVALLIKREIRNSKTSSSSISDSFLLKGAEGDGDSL